MGHPRRPLPGREPCEYLSPATQRRFLVPLRSHMVTVSRAQLRPRTALQGLCRGGAGTLVCWEPLTQAGYTRASGGMNLRRP